MAYVSDYEGNTTIYSDFYRQNQVVNGKMTGNWFKHLKTETTVQVMSIVIPVDDVDQLRFQLSGKPCLVQIPPICFVCGITFQFSTYSPDMNISI